LARRIRGDFGFIKGFGVTIVKNHIRHAIVAVRHAACIDFPAHGTPRKMTFDMFSMPPSFLNG